MKTHWSYTSMPYKVLGIHYVPFLWGLLLFFWIILIKPNTFLAILAVSFFVGCLWYSKKHSIQLTQIPERILSTMVGREKKPRVFKDDRDYE